MTVRASRARYGEEASDSAHPYGLIPSREALPLGEVPSGRLDLRVGIGCLGIPPT